MKLTINPSVRTVTCRACGGGGDTFDGETVETCPICGGSGRHAADATYGVIDADGGRVLYDGEAERDGTRGVAVLAALNSTRRHIYAGTAPAAAVARRRTANKAARRSRRTNRRSAR